MLARITWNLLNVFSHFDSFYYSKSYHNSQVDPSFLLKMLRDGRLQQGVDCITESYYKAMAEMRDIIQIIPKQDFRSILIQNLIMAKVFKSAKLKEICFSFDK